MEDRIETFGGERRGLVEQGAGARLHARILQQVGGWRDQVGEHERVDGSATQALRARAACARAVRR